MKNVNYNPSDAEFWDFSWDEMAKYDLPTHINYVLSYTGASTLSYIGHSEVNQFRNHD
jgi:lysosomal acid lipase/cholesteryl ester hydrolase